jgi:glycerol-3-phosphate dehydrogenase
VAEVLTGVLRQNSREAVRLVRGSHIIVRRMFDHDQPYFLQQPDGRIIFAIPYETDFTLIGTTDQEHEDPSVPPVCTDEERDYLLQAASYYFRTPVTKSDIVRTYSGVRPLYDDNASSATAATRDYVLSLSANADDAPLVSVFGGKITTYRRLAEEAVNRLAPFLSPLRPAWTAGAPLPGGDFPIDGAASLAETLAASFPFLTPRWALRLVRAYGTDANLILGKAQSAEDLGQDFGATLTEAEIRWLMEQEWAETAEDVLWRRSKLGLHLTSAEVENVSRWMSLANIK